MTRFWTADLHFGHANIIAYTGRPFADVARMNDELVARWNTTVGTDDEVWVLGDVALGSIDDSLSVVERLNGRKLLVPGNHDRCWRGHGPRSTGWDRRYLEAGFDAILAGTVRTCLGERPVMCSHFPYEGDSQDLDRHVRHRPVNRGEPLLHGHVHTRWRARGSQINVGVDVWDYRPVPDEVIAGLLPRT